MTSSAKMLEVRNYKSYMSMYFNCSCFSEDFILAFSLHTNIRKLCSVNSENDIDAIHTIRFVNGIMLLAAHKSMASLFLPYVNKTAAAKVSKKEIKKIFIKDITAEHVDCLY